MKNGSTDVDIVNPALDLPRPQMVELEDNSVWKNGLPTVRPEMAGSGSKSGASGRLQDKALQEMSDRGLCMSMHQVRPLTHFFLFPFYENSLICLDLPSRQINDPLIGETLFSSVSPSNSLISVLDPQRAFLS